MKAKLLLSSLVLAVVASTSSFAGVLNDQMRYGVGVLNGNANFGVFTKSYDVSVFAGNSSDDAASKTETTTIGLNAQYKTGVDASTYLTYGVNYAFVSGKNAGVSRDGNYKLGVTLGLQKELSSNVLFEVKSVLFGLSKEAATTTTILSDVQLGVSYLF